MKNLVLYFNYFTLHTPYQNIYPYIFSSFKKFHPSPLQNKYTFVIQTMAFQANYLATVFQSHTTWL